MMEKVNFLTTGKLTVICPLSVCTLTNDMFQGFLCGMAMASNRIPMSSRHILLKKAHVFRMNFIGRIDSPFTDY